MPLASNLAINKSKNKLFLYTIYKKTFIYRK